MAAGHFFVGLGAGVALLTIPVLVFTPVPQQLVAWIDGPPPAPPSGSNIAAAQVASRPVRGYVPGASEPAPLEQAPPPTLAPAQEPTPTALPTAPVIGVAPPSSSGLRTGVIHAAAGQGAYVRRAPGVESPTDPILANGSPVLVSGGAGTRVGSELWRAIRGLNGISGWVPYSQVSVDGEGPPQPATGQLPAQPTPLAQQELARVANTGGVGVVLRGSPNDADRRPAGLAEGATVAVVERSGNDWVHVRTDTGLDGWVPAKYLTPTTQR